MRHKRLAFRLHRRNSGSIGAWPRGELVQSQRLGMCSQVVLSVRGSQWIIVHRSLSLSLSHRFSLVWFFEMDTWRDFEMGLDGKFKIWKVKDENWKINVIAINSLLCPFLVSGKKKSKKKKISCGIPNQIKLQVPPFHLSRTYISF